MKSMVQHEIYGLIEYEENSWTGKKNIKINNVCLKKVDKKKYVYDNGEKQFDVTVHGSYLLGVKLIIEGETIQLVKDAEWYEIACFAASMVFFLIWSNVPFLCAIVPILGGFFGALIIAPMNILSFWLVKKQKSVALKFLVWFGMFCATFFLDFLAALPFVLIGALI